MSTRRRAREIVLQLLYEADVNDRRDSEGARKFIRSRMQGRKALTDFGCALFNGTIDRRDEIDGYLAKLATNWALHRMPVVDRNVLRLGAYEILFAETPSRVAVNESVVLAKRYGDKSSPRFVNGILDRLMKNADERRDLGSQKGSPVPSAPAKPDFVRSSPLKTFVPSSSKPKPELSATGAESSGLTTPEVVTPEPPESESPITPVAPSIPEPAIEQPVLDIAVEQVAADDVVSVQDGSQSNDSSAGTPEGIVPEPDAPQASTADATTAVSSDSVPKFRKKPIYRRTDSR